jgi:hypothetical protein
MNQKEKDFHKANLKADAEHRATVGKAVSQIIDSHSALAEHYAVTDPIASKHHADLAEAGKDQLSALAQDGQRCLTACDKLDAMPTNEGDGKGSSELKIILGELQKLSTGLPAGLSAIPRNNNPTLVPRPGQPDSDTQKALKDSVAPELKDIIFDPKVAIG